MADNFLKGYEATAPEDADAPTETSGQPYLRIGGMAEEYKRRWKVAPVAYPFGTAKDGGGGGGE